MKNKTLIVLLSLIVLFAAFVPKVNAAATFSIPDIFGWIQDNTVGAFVRGLVFFINGAFTALSAWIMGIGQGALSWVISSDFMGMSMTGTDNPIINYGWPIIRDIANIFLVLSLVVIGLGMIMGIEEYQAKRTLPRLIGIAILINFTPVICGLIVDFTNLLMNYLLRGGSLDPGMANSVTAGIQAINQNNPYDALARLIIFFIFSIAFSIICFVYFLLFLFRYIFIWVLVIFSPLAFVSKVFPTGWARDFFPSFFYWDEWWKQFIHWSVIGIYAAFFLSLANNMTILIGQGKFRMSAPSGVLGIFQQLFLYIFPMALMIIGLNSIMEETSGIIEKGKKTLTPKIGEAIGTTGLGLAGGAVAGAALGAKQGTGAWGRMAGAARGALSAGGREEGVKAVRGWAERRAIVGRALGGPGAAEKDYESKENAARKRVQAIPDTPTGNKQLAERTLMWPVTEEDYFDRLAAMEELAKRKELPDATVKKYASEYQKAGGNTTTILKARPDLSGAFTDSKTGANLTVRQGMAKIEPNDFWKTVQKDALKDNDVVFEFLLDEMKFDKATKNMKPENKKAIKEAVSKGLVGPRKITNEEKALLKKHLNMLKTDDRWQV